MWQLTPRKSVNVLLNLCFSEIKWFDFNEFIRLTYNSILIAKIQCYSKPKHAVNRLESRRSECNRASNIVGDTSVQSDYYKIASRKHTSIIHPTRNVFTNMQHVIRVLNGLVQQRQCRYFWELAPYSQLIDVTPLLTPFNWVTRPHILEAHVTIVPCRRHSRKQKLLHWGNSQRISCRSPCMLSKYRKSVRRCKEETRKRSNLRQISSGMK